MENKKYSLDEIKENVREAVEKHIRDSVKNGNFALPETILVSQSKNKEMKTSDQDTIRNNGILLRISFSRGIDTYCLEIINGCIIGTIMDYQIKTFDNRNALLNFLKDGLCDGDKA